MRIEVVLLPRELKPQDLPEKTVVVFDVLRATTSMTAALAAGVKEIRCFGSVDAAVAAARASRESPLLAGEVDAIKPPGFDLGNSPGVFRPEEHAGRIVYMSTTNGTRAILSARGAHTIFIGALVSAQAVARAVRDNGRDVTLLCSGTQGYISGEDVLGAGAVIEHLRESDSAPDLASDVAWMAWQLFRSQRADLLAALSATRGGQNVTRAGLTPDITFAARLNAIPLVGISSGDPPVVRRCNGLGR